MLPSPDFFLSMRTSFGSQRHQLLAAVIWTLSVFEARTRRSPFRLRTRIHCPAGTRSLSVHVRSDCRSCAARMAGARTSAVRVSRRSSGIAESPGGSRTSLAAASAGREGDVAAERLGGDAGGALPEGEAEALVVMIARLERDREVALDAAVVGGDVELRADVGRKRQANLARMRGVLVPAVGQDLAREVHVAAGRVRADLLRHY